MEKFRQDLRAQGGLAALFDGNKATKGISRKKSVRRARSSFSTNGNENNHEDSSNLHDDINSSGTSHRSRRLRGGASVSVRAKPHRRAVRDSSQEEELSSNDDDDVEHPDPPIHGMPLVSSSSMDISPSSLSTNASSVTQINTTRRHRTPKTSSTTDQL